LSEHRRHDMRGMIIWVSSNKRQSRFGRDGRDAAAPQRYIRPTLYRQRSFVFYREWALRSGAWSKGCLTASYRSLIMPTTFCIGPAVFILGESFSRQQVIPCGWAAFSITEHGSLSGERCISCTWRSHYSRSGTIVTGNPVQTTDG
jgi:hypothetical protein